MVTWALFGCFSLTRQPTQFVHRSYRAGLPLPLYSPSILPHLPLSLSHPVSSQVQAPTLRPASAWDSGVFLLGSPSPQAPAGGTAPGPQACLLPGVAAQGRAVPTTYLAAFPPFSCHLQRCLGSRCLVSPPSLSALSPIVPSFSGPMWGAWLEAHGTGRGWEVVSVGSFQGNVWCADLGCSSGLLVTNGELLPSHLSPPFTISWMWNVPWCGPGT